VGAVARCRNAAGSAELHAVLLQGVVAQRQPEPRGLGQRPEAVDDRPALAEQPEPQGIAGALVIVLVQARTGCGNGAESRDVWSPVTFTLTGP
jgi:hypothetical protein